MAPRKSPATPRRSPAAALERTRSTHREEGSRNAYNRRHHHPERAGVAVTWLRIDDGYDTHPKLLELTEQQRWRWTRVLIHCSRHQTQGHVKTAVLRELGLGRTTQKLIGLGLLEQNGEAGYLVHDWAIFNPKDPTAAARMQRRRATVPSAEAGQWKRTRYAVFQRDHGICADCGKDCSQPSDDGRDVWNADHEPPREDLIAAGESIYDLRFIVTRCHSCHAKKTRRQATERNTERDRTQSEQPTERNRYSRAGTGARPVPSLKTTPSNNGSLDVAADDVDEQELARVNILLAQAAIEDMGP